MESLLGKISIFGNFLFTKTKMIITANKRTVPFVRILIKEPIPKLLG